MDLTGQVVSHRLLAVWLLSAAGGLSISSRSIAQEASANLRESEIVVSATGSVALEPDHAVILFAVVTRDPRAERAAEANAEIMAAVLDTLERLGFSRDSVPTFRYTVRPEYETDRGRRRVVGHVAEAIRQVEETDLASVGAVIDAVLAGGASEVPSISFRSKRRQAARLEALRKAMDAARMEADAIARAAGGRVGRLLEASTAPVLVAPTQRVEVAALRAGTEISPPALTVSATVTVRWQFVPNL